MEKFNQSPSSDEIKTGETIPDQGAGLDQGLITRGFPMKIGIQQPLFDVVQAPLQGRFQFVISVFWESGLTDQCSTFASALW